MDSCFCKTKMVKIGSYYHCAYCGKLASEEAVREYRDCYSYYSCNCEGSELEMEKEAIERKLRELEETNLNSYKFRKLQYENEIKYLKNKYRIKE